MKFNPCALFICAAFGLLTPTLFAQASFKTLYAFANSDKAYPTAAPVEVARGVFIGAANSVYRITSGGRFSNLNGDGFAGGLFPASNGLLYGQYVDAVGVYPDLVSVSPSGTFMEFFAPYFYPQLMEARDGTLVGFTQVLDSPQSSEQLLSFTLDGVYTFIGPALPLEATGAPVQTKDRNFYAAFIVKEDIGSFVILRISPQGVASLVHAGDSSEGGYPSGPLLEVNGVLYGECVYGGNGVTGPNSGDGLIFSITPSGAFNVVHLFEGGAQGANPRGGLILASDGNLYGTASSSESVNTQIFRLSPDGSSYSVVYQASGSELPVAPALTQGSDGNLYGVMHEGSDNSGSVFQLGLGLPAPLPSIAYFSPASASPGDKVLIRGSQLLGVSSVSFNGTPSGSIQSAGTDYVYAIVPPGASTGPVTISTPNGSGVSQGSFVVR